MPAPVSLIRCEEVLPGQSVTVEHQGREFVVFNVEGEFYTLPNLCPHIGGPLADGPIEGRVVVCPWHGWQFDITTGNCLAHSRHVACYPTQVAGDWVVADLPE